LRPFCSLCSPWPSKPMPAVAVAVGVEVVEVAAGAEAAAEVDSQVVVEAEAVEVEVVSPAAAGAVSPAQGRPAAEAFPREVEVAAGAISAAEDPLLLPLEAVRGAAWIAVPVCLSVKECRGAVRQAYPTDPDRWGRPRGPRIARPA
jgi:hypothetical protein